MAAALIHGNPPLSLSVPLAVDAPEAKEPVSHGRGPGKGRSSSPSLSSLSPSLSFYPQTAAKHSVLLPLFLPF